MALDRNNMSTGGNVKPVQPPEDEWMKGAEEASSALGEYNKGKIPATSALALGGGKGKAPDLGGPREGGNVPVGGTPPAPTVPPVPGSVPELPPGTPGQVTGGPGAWYNRDGKGPYGEDPRDYTSNKGYAAKREYGVQLPHLVDQPQHYVKDWSTVQGQLEKILKSDSALMKQADARGRAQAQAQGWSSSSAGAAARESAMINAALPIAQQDAATFARFAENQQNADIAIELSTYNHNLAVRLNEMNIDAAEKQGVMAMVGSLTNNYMQMIGNLNQNTNISDEDKKSIGALMKTQYENSTNLYAMFAELGIDFVI